MTLNCHSWQEENQLDKIKILAERIKKEQYENITFFDAHCFMHVGTDWV